MSENSHPYCDSNLGFTNVKNFPVTSTDNYDFSGPDNQSDNLLFC